MHNFFSVQKASLWSQGGIVAIFQRATKSWRHCPAQGKWDNLKALGSGSRSQGLLWEPALALLTSRGNSKVFHLSKILHSHYALDLHKQFCYLTPFTFGNFLQTWRDLDHTYKAFHQSLIQVHQFRFQSQMRYTSGSDPHIDSNRSHSQQLVCANHQYLLTQTSV